LAQNKFKFHAGLKSAILAIFQIGLGWLCPVSATLKNPSKEFNNSFCFWCRLIPRKPKVKRAHFSKVQFGKITVCLTFCENSNQGRGNYSKIRVQIPAPEGQFFYPFSFHFQILPSKLNSMCKPSINILFYKSDTNKSKVFNMFYLISK
jgi:hypothetical protein